MPDSKKPPPHVLEDDDEQDDTVVEVSGGGKAEPGLTELARDYETIRAGVPARSGPSDLPGFADDDDDDDEDATDVLSRADFLGSHAELNGVVSDPRSDTPARARVRSLDGPRLADATSEGARASIVADDDDDDPDGETSVLRPPPRPLRELAPMSFDDDLDDMTLSRPVVHRRTFRPSGEGSPQRRLERAGGPPTMGLPPSIRGARSVISVPPTKAEPGPGEPRRGPASIVVDSDPDEETLTLPRDPQKPTASMEKTPVPPIEQAPRARPKPRPLPPPPTIDFSDADTVTPQSKRPSDPASLRSADFVVDDHLPNSKADAPGPKRLPAAVPAGPTEVSEMTGLSDTSELSSLADSADSDDDDDDDGGGGGRLVIVAPHDATVFLDGKEVGRGEVTIKNVDRFAQLNLRVHCAGFYPWTETANLRGAAAATITPDLKPR